ncbi:SCP2 domain-containing protein [Deinococcus saxicola]|uniref:hypothetical protein n=1 Tax=Deinococcus saxicola TaxID=249406 RepID=UPI0039EE0C05
MIPAIPRAADLAACTSEAALLRMTGQCAIPLHITYLESCRPIRLPRRVTVGVLLRPRVCREMLDGPRQEPPTGPPPVMRVIRTGQPEPTLDLWPPGQGRAV